LTYIARTNKDRDGELPEGEVLREQLLIDHLQGVAKYAREFASKFGMERMAEFLGLCHDLGKYSCEFQDRVRGASIKVDHTTAGGQKLIEIMVGEQKLTDVTLADLLANCIFGHHGGLLNQGESADIGHEKRSVFARKSKNVGEGQFVFGDFHAYASEVNLENPTSAFLEACAKMKPICTAKKKGQQSFSNSFLTRMLFSCLVDGDYLDTEKFMKGDVGRSDHDDMTTLLERLNQKLEKFTDIKGLNQYRNDILQSCINKAKGEKGLYSLTVPTGGGKTLSSMAFALNHAKKHQMDRIIYVIPYTSIIEQNAQVFSDIFDVKDANGKMIKRNVLENHSNADYDNEDTSAGYQYLAAENWDIPIVVTTNVQFFESLFSHQTSKTRKLHNISNSVIIFDEAQMLPTDYLKPCVYAIEELIRNYEVTAVLCTATQPSLNLVFPEGSKAPIEICENFKALYDKLKRVTYEDAGVLNNAQLLEKLNGQTQVLCIVNSRQHARELFAGLEGEFNYHLSTLMYPEHRKQQLLEIKKRLAAGQPVKVISTSLIEAGVDVDFAIVYRAKAGLDSVIQAGGRCNREGKRALETSKVYMFEPDPEEVKPPRGLALNLSATDNALSKGFEMGSPEQIKAYFDYLYKTKGDSLDKKTKDYPTEGIVDRLQKLYIQFEDISNDFKLIESGNTKTIFIPKDKEADKLLHQLKNTGISKSLYRKLGSFSVTIPIYEYNKLDEERIFENVEGVIVLTDLDAYCDESGLKVDFEYRADGIFY